MKSIKIYGSALIDCETNNYIMCMFNTEKQCVQGCAAFNFIDGETRKAECIRSGCEFGWIQEQKK